ncbi:MAG: chalcone isomerase family protein [Planctomycetota bacterium]
MKHVIHTFVIALIIATSAVTVQAHMPNSLEVGGTELMLNGVGMRQSGLVKPYQAGLYLAHRTADATAIVSGDEPMALRIEITSLLVTPKNLEESMHEGFVKSTNGDLQSIGPEIDQFKKCLPAKVSKGDIFEFNYLPGTGVTVLENGENKGVVTGMPFKQALFGIWLGKEPADANLKRRLLNP